jgi:hypothetical protein
MSMEHVYHYNRFKYVPLNDTVCRSYDRREESDAKTMPNHAA